MWIGKNATGNDGSRHRAPQQKAAPAPARELHVPHNVESMVSAFLVQNGRLEMRLGKHLLHFMSVTRNDDGSVDYRVRSRIHTHNGLERNFESHVRIHADHSLKLIR